MQRRPAIDRDLARYLVPGEQVVTAVRRHWFSEVHTVLALVAATALAIAADRYLPANRAGQAFVNAAWMLWYVALAWFFWRLLNWRHEFFVATDKRLLLFYGFVRRKVAMMPMLKVTDMTFDRSVMGRLIGYGDFILESAGNHQALSTIEYIPDADHHYRNICEVLFGGGRGRFLGGPGRGGGWLGPGDGDGDPSPGDSGPPPGDAPPSDGPLALDPDQPLDPVPESWTARIRRWFARDRDAEIHGWHDEAPFGPEAAWPASVDSGGVQDHGVDGSPRPARRHTPSSGRAESLYRSPDLVRADRQADTGEIPVVRPRRMRGPEDLLYPPVDWRD